jgi:DNA-binding response OmpR family regulator
VSEGRQGGAARVLVVEDDQLTATMVCTNLEHEGFQVRLASDGDQAIEAIESEAFDLLVLDYMLPGRNGLQILEHARAQAIGTPVMMLTARAETRLKVEAFGLGADDYLTKPFHVDELLARAHALIRRARAQLELPAERRVRMGRVWIDFTRRVAVADDGTEEQLGDKELGMLDLFAREPGRVFSRLDILDEVWGMDANPVARTVDNYIMMLRRILEPDSENPVHLLTVRGEGWQYRGA